MPGVKLTKKHSKAGEEIRQGDISQEHVSAAWLYSWKVKVKEIKLVKLNLAET